MKKKKGKAPRMTPANALLFGLAALLLLTGTAGSSRAALTYFSENYVAEIDMKDIGVTLTENGDPVSRRDYTQKDDKWNETIEDKNKDGKLLTGMLKEGETLQLGKPYKEEIAVKNSGNIDEYVRLTVFRYWAEADEDGNLVRDEDGNPKKRTDMKPTLIDLDMKDVAAANGWIIDPKSESESGERTVFYYSNVLKTGSSTKPISEWLKIDPAAGGEAVTTEETTADGGKIIKVTYEYDGAQFVLEAEADAVQTHNAVDAIKSAWGVDVNIAGENGPLSLK